jgi:hypothetical protein
MDEPFSECSAIDDERPIRQGDVFIWLASEDPWTRVGVIVTGDCDIEHDKHRGLLSYVPVLKLTDYLAAFHLPSKVQRACVPLREQLLKAVRKFQAEQLPAFPEPISEQAAMRWLKDTTPSEVASDLKVPPGRELDSFLQAAAEFLAADSALAAGEFDPLFEAILRARLRQGSSSTREQIATKVWAELEQFVTNLPGDAFFLGMLGPEHSAGYVAYLRLVREIRQATIAIKQTDLRAPGVTAKRITRLKSPYVYRLTQQLGEVFAAIGLPKEYEEARAKLLRGPASSGESSAAGQRT